MKSKIAIVIFFCFASVTARAGIVDEVVGTPFWEGRSVGIRAPVGDVFNRCAFADGKKMEVKGEIRREGDQYRLFLSPQDVERLNECHIEQMRADMAARKAKE